MGIVHQRLLCCFFFVTSFHLPIKLSLSDVLSLQMFSSLFFSCYFVYNFNVQLLIFFWKGFLFYFPLITCLLYSSSLSLIYSYSPVSSLVTLLGQLIQRHLTAAMVDFHLSIVSLLSLLTHISLFFSSFFIQASQPSFPHSSHHSPLSRPPTHTLLPFFVFPFSPPVF